MLSIGTKIGDLDWP